MLVKSLVRIVIAVLVGVLVGLMITSRSLDRSNLGDTIGPWHGAPRDGTGEIDPYALAATARASLLPLGSSEGLSFVAEQDSSGSGLRSTCDYTVKGPIPPARFWTLSLLTPNGFPVADPADRYAFTSAEVLRIVDEPLTIHVSHGVHSGNWLPTGALDRYVLMLRLYDTGLSTVGSTLEAAAMPKIERLACR